MTQPPYRPPNDHSMRRFALFVAAFIVVVAIGAAQPRRANSSSNSVCVCIPSRAGLLLKSAIVKTQVRTAALFTQ